MTRRTVPMAVPMGRAAGALPRAIHVGSATLEISPDGETISTHLGRGVRFNANWSKAGGRGKATIDITQTSKMTAEISVGLEAPGGLARLLFSGPRLHRTAELFAHALRYEVETRASEQTSGFEVRRTNAGLVKARSA